MSKKNMFNLDVTYPVMPLKPSLWQKFKMKCYYAIQVNPSCPDTVTYFKSEVAIINEKKRQYRAFRYTIHPLSKFNYAYQIWSFFFYIILVFFKAFDFGFIHIGHDNGQNQRLAIIVSLSLDILALLNIPLQFWIGYCIPATRSVELSRYQIGKRYILSGHFCCDLFSSIPELIIQRANRIVKLIIISLNLLKLRRTSTIIELIPPTANFFRIKSSSHMFLCGFFIVVSLVMHVMTCLHAGITLYRTELQQGNDSVQSLAQKMKTALPLMRQYMIMLFKSAQYSLLIDLGPIADSHHVEEVIVSIITYIVGKLILTATWVVFLFTFLSQRTLRIKFEEIMTELNEYMVARKLSPALRDRLIVYYKYKYQKVFFNEMLVKTVLSENLKREIDVFLCKSLIHHVSIFRHVPAKVVKQVVTYLVPQIFLPNDLIIQSGTTGDCMYFIESGTVAVYTPSGKEMCHLQDGSYFGEISVLINNSKRPVSIVAVEITRVYMLSRTHFKRCFQPDDLFYKYLLEKAEVRFSRYKAEEEAHKNAYLLRNLMKKNN